MRWYHSETGVTIVNWMDRNNVIMGYTLPYYVEDTSSAYRSVVNEDTGAWEGRRPIACPMAVCYYNTNMRGVDR
jgi:hypothetical protein